MRSIPGECTAIEDKFTRFLRWCSATLAAAALVAGCGGGDPSPPTSAPVQAAPAGLAGMAAAQQSVNARMAAPRAVALAAVSPGSATENFDAGMSDWSNWGNAQVVAGAGTSGSNAMQVGTAAGGAGLNVPGIVPDTAYRLTAQVRVSDRSETVFMGVNFLSSSGGLVIGQSAPPVTNTGYVTLTFDVVAPAGSATAVVWVWKNAGSGFGYVDEIAFGPAANPPPPPPTPTDTNLVTNGGFESGMTDWSNWGNAAVVSGQANSGTSALRVGTAAGGAGHDVGGIVPGTTYRLVAQAKVSDPSETVYVGVNVLNAAGDPVTQISLPVSTTSYSTVTFDVRALSTAARAVVYVWKNDGSGFGDVDDVTFGVAPGSAPPPAPPPAGNLVANGGFEQGIANWQDWGNASTSTAQAGAGSAAAQVGTGAGGLGQNVGIVAGTTYRLSGLVKVSGAGSSAWLGVKFTDDAGNKLLEQSVLFSSTAYSIAQLNVTAPADATRALVYVWKDPDSGYAYVDEVALAPAVQTVALTVTREQVNPVETGRHYHAPAIARLTTGGYVIAWHATPSTSGSGLPDTCFHRYDASGASSAPAACVAGAHPGASIPQVVARAGGGFTIIWNEGTSSSDPAGLRWQDYDQAGAAEGAIQAGPLPLRLTAQPLVGGGYVKLLFASDPLAFQRYAADGTPLGQPQAVTATSASGRVVALAGGGFAVAWSERDATGANVAMTRAFAADGTPAGDAIAIAPNTLGPIGCSKGGTPCPPWQIVLGIAATPDGGYIVAWIDGTGIATNGGSFARQFRADGSAASSVVGRIGQALAGPIAAVGADSFVMPVEESDAAGTIGISALHVGTAPLR